MLSTNDAASSLGDSIKEDQVLLAIHKYEKYHVCHGGEEEERNSNYADMVNKYYDLVTSFYEYGWGESFHFAPRWKGETVRESLKRHEHFIASKLQLGPGQKVLDIGCGIGGPLREIARFSSASITGLNNHEYQIKRAKEFDKKAGVDKFCDYVKADFMKMPFSENCFDAAYAIQATCHAPDPVECYKEIYRVLKPGQCLVLDEWCLTDSFDPQNLEHQSIKAEIEIGNGLPSMRTTRECYKAVEKAGFEVVWEKDLGLYDHISQLPWYSALQDQFALTPIGRVVIKYQIKMLEALRIAPKGSQRVHAFLQQGGDGDIKGGMKGIFTPLYFVLARKPLN